MTLNWVFEFEDASASSWSSVTNYTEPRSSEAAIDFTNPSTRAERRRILKRLREKPAQEQPEPGKYRSELSQCTEREALKKSSFEILRLTLSDGEAERMRKGHTIKVVRIQFIADDSLITNCQEDVLKMALSMISDMAGTIDTAIYEAAIYCQAE
ncbi:MULTISPECIES: hypothetical protein [Pantoea]|uniref:hypothetical protein n=1 Tax=Pantoea TaxID=53335 RepID=UPI001913F8A0|nr:MULTISPECIES: hypothetical protein [Pantoea]